MWSDESVSLVPVEWLKAEEEVRVRARDKLLEMTKKWGGFTKPLVVDKKTGSLLDGHHRHSVACLLNLNSVPAICVDYFSDESIIVETWPNSELDEIRLYQYNWIGDSRNINHSNFWHNAATK